MWTCRGQFQKAAAELSVTQQAVSKRVAALETELGVCLFTRTPKGARLTVDGQAFLPHARAVLAAAARAVKSVRPGRRALRVDVLGRRMAPANLLKAFHAAHARIELDVVTLGNEAAAIEAVVTGSVDATFRAGRTRLSPGLASTRALNETLDLLTGPAHELAGATSMRLEGLAGQRIWLPGFVTGAEWTVYYEELAAALGMRIDNRHPGLRALREHLGHTRKAGVGEFWTPSWV